MIAKLLQDYRHIWHALLVVVGFIVLREATGVASWVLLVPYLFALFILVRFVAVLKNWGVSNGR